MPRTSRVERQAHVRAIERLIAAGMTPREAAKAYQAQIHDQGKPPIEKRRLKRYEKASKAGWGREASQSVKESHAISLMRAHQAMRMAASATKIIVIDGEVRRESEPDTKAFLDALRETNRLTGVDLAVYAAAGRGFADLFFACFFEMLRMTESDPVKRARQMDCMQQLLRERGPPGIVDAPVTLAPIVDQKRDDAPTLGEGDPGDPATNGHA